MKTLTKSDTEMMIQATIILANEASCFFIKQDNRYLPDSQADKEISSSTNSLVKVAYEQSSFLIESGGDHFQALEKLLTEPVSVFAPWTCVRALVEASSLAIWLLDNEIDKNKRVERSLSLRCSGLNEQLKLARDYNAEDAMEAIKSRMKAVKDKAANCGYSKIPGMPPKTDLINTYMGEVVSYRVLSAIAHSDITALQQKGFWQPLSDPNHIEKRIKLDDVATICQSGTIAFSKAIWYMAIVFGWNVEDLEVIFQRVFDTLKIPQEDRFWSRA